MNESEKRAKQVRKAARMTRQLLDLAVKLEELTDKFWYEGIMPLDLDDDTEALANKIRHDLSIVYFHLIELEPYLFELDNEEDV